MSNQALPIRECLLPAAAIDREIQGIHADTTLVLADDVIA
jgi:hypothetical protein